MKAYSMDLMVVVVVVDHKLLKYLKKTISKERWKE
jgi:hypothetical protein